MTRVLHPSTPTFFCSFFFFNLCSPTDTRLGSKDCWLERNEEVKCPVGIESQAPKKRTTCPIPKSQTEKQESDRPLFLSRSSSRSLCFLPHSGIFPLFARGLLSPLPPLSPFLAPPAGHDDDEEHEHAGDAAPDGDRQPKDLREGR